MPGVAPIDRFYNEATAVVEALRSIPDVSLEVTARDHFRKALLLAAASYFEHRVCSCVIHFVRRRSGNSVLVVLNKAAARQYHTWFKWDDSNANQFFGLFGPDFRQEMSNRVKNSDDFRDSVKAFLEIGSQRNQLIHGDYATFALDKTLDEIYYTYKRALMFVEQLPKALQDCDESSEPVR